MSVVAGIGKATPGAQVLTGTTPTTRAFPKSKWMMAVALALLTLLTLAVVIPASQAPNAEHYYYSVGTKDYQAATEPTAQPLSEAGAAPQMSEKEALEAYGKLPLSFVPNKGQTNEETVRHYAQGAGYGFFFTKGGAMLSFSDGEGRGHALGLDFLGANPNATLTAQKQLSGEVNYLVGDDPANWQQGLPTHAELLYGGLWPGIDMAVRGEGGKLKYEFHLKPGSSVKDIRLDYRGAEGLSVGAGGELLVRTSLGTLKDAAPVSYQLIGGERVGVESRYKLLKGEGGGGYGFAVGAYDPRYPLIIDPELDYSTFLGGTGDEAGEGIRVREGRAYVTGITQSTDFPTTTGAFDTTLGGASDAFVTKLNASGSALVYSTFLGGTDSDHGEDIAVDASGRAYVTGDTFSGDFPTTTGAFDTTFNGGIVDAFVTKLSASGSALVYSTFLGGTNQDEGQGIGVREGRAYVTGITQSTDFPTTTGAFDRTHNGSEDAYVTKFNASGSALVYSTLFGGADQERGLGIRVREGRAYVMGLTDSTDYPTTRGAFDRTYNGGRDAFVAKLNATGSGLAYSTFLGGASEDEGLDIAVDGEGRAYATGSTESPDFPTTQGAFDRTHNVGDDIFVTKLNASGSALAYSTFLGGANFEAGEGIRVREGRAYATGSTESPNFPTTTGAFDTTLGGASDAFVTKLNASGSALAYSTFLGGTNLEFGEGIAVSRRGRAYVTGVTFSGDFPTTAGAYDTTLGGERDAYVTKLPTG
jgi:Beta-propeller repeat